jgi:uncharacterized membrane protein
MLSLKNLLTPQVALYKLLNYKGINIDVKIIQDELEKHPDFPSLLAVCDVLTALNIENVAFKVSFDELANVPCPFIAHTNTSNGDLITVTRLDGDDIYISTDKLEKQRTDAAEFKKKFTGVVLTVQASENFDVVKTPKDVLTAIRIPAIVTGMALILALALIFHTGYFANLNWEMLALTIFKSAGLITSILLLVQSVDSNNPLVQVICQSGGKTDCNAILSSKAANVFEGLTWSEVGFFYFAGTWLLLLFGGGSTSIWLSLAVLNFISLPYTVYSIYYQARVAKQWCVLCCTVQALLWLEFIPLILYITGNIHAYAEAWPQVLSTLLICLLAPVVLWIMLKPLFLKIQQLPSLKQQLRNFKYNTELFDKMLTDQPKYALPAEEWSIVLGNVEANNIITMATNPFCGPCAKTHKLLDELLEHNDNVQARIVFATGNSEVSRHMMALNELSDKKIIKQALHDWYEQKQKNYQAWAKDYPVQLDETEAYKLEKQKDWCKMASITGTPTLLLNGYLLPQLYQLPDLKYMLQ